MKIAILSKLIDSMFGIIDLKELQAQPGHLWGSYYSRVLLSWPFVNMKNGHLGMKTCHVAVKKILPCNDVGVAYLEFGCIWEECLVVKCEFQMAAQSPT